MKEKIGSRRDLTGPLLEVIAAGGVAHPDHNEGEVVPHIIVDATSFPALSEAISVQESAPPGDVKSQWATLASDRTIVVLQLELLRPVPLTFAIQFDGKRRAATIDAIMDLKKMHLQAGKPGDTMYSTMGTPAMAVEVLGTSEGWPKQVRRILERQLAREGVRRQDIRAAVDATLKRWSEFRRLPRKG